MPTLYVSRQFSSEEDARLLESRQLHPKRAAQRVLVALQESGDCLPPRVTSSLRNAFASVETHTDMDCAVLLLEIAAQIFGVRIC